jgi:hypothetical protein
VTSVCHEIKGGRAVAAEKYFQKNEDFWKNGVLGPYMYGRDPRFLKICLGEGPGPTKKVGRRGGAVFYNSV